MYTDMSKLTMATENDSCAPMVVECHKTATDTMYQF